MSCYTARHLFCFYFISNRKHAYKGSIRHYIFSKGDVSMLLRRLKLVNYGGIYNGMGLYEINIDFTKCKNRIILIKGDNGSGKSTIESALKPLPDDNMSFIMGKDALKEIEYFDEINNCVYSIKFIHECKGFSRTSKGYFYKILSSVKFFTK